MGCLFVPRATSRQNELRHLCWRLCRRHDASATILSGIPLSNSEQGDILSIPIGIDPWRPSHNHCISWAPWPFQPSAFMLTLITGRLIHVWSGFNHVSHTYEYFCHWGRAIFCIQERGRKVSSSSKDHCCSSVMICSSRRET